MAFERRHSVVADSTFSPNGADNWNANQTPSGADVGGIPYCPTATTETTSAKFIFDGVTLALAMGTVTAAPGAISITQTRNAAGTTFDAVIKAVLTDTASAAGSLAMQILGGAAGTDNLFILNKSGTGTFFLGVAASTVTASDYLLASAGRIYLRTNTGFGVMFGASDDTNLSRISAGLIGVGTGAAGRFAGRLKLTSAIAAGVAVGSLNAAPTTGEVQSVTDALAPAVGVQVAAGGAAKALVWYNGAQWTVIGI